ncbi:hypothetical protein Tco_1456783 [Tanacetum coccineum]
MPVMRSLAHTLVDLLPPRKRFRDSYSFEASIEEDTKIDPIETEVDIELGIGDGDDVRDHVGIDPDVGPIVREEIVEPVEQDSSGIRDGIVQVRIDRIVRIETVQRRLEATVIRLAPKFYYGPPHDPPPHPTPPDVPAPL